MKRNILFINLLINLPSSSRRIFLHSSVTMPASLLLHEEKSTREPDEILIKKKSKQLRFLNFRKYSEYLGKKQINES